MLSAALSVPVLSPGVGREDGNVPAPVLSAGSFLTPTPSVSVDGRTPSFLTPMAAFLRALALPMAVARFLRTEVGVRGVLGVPELGLVEMAKWPSPPPLCLTRERSLTSRSEMARAVGFSVPALGC